MREWGVMLAAGWELPSRRALYQLTLESPKNMVHDALLA